MEPVLAREPFDNPNYVFQVKWDGLRMLLYYNKEGIILQNRRLHIRTAQYPELAALPDLVRKPVVLDGEVISLVEGKPSFHQVMRREAAGEKSSELINEVPIYYMVFDLLFWDKKSTINQPWQERNGLLKEILHLEPPFTVVDSFDQGILLFEQVKKLNLEGIVAKDRNSPYIPGKKSSYWLKVKNRRHTECLVGGYIKKNGRIRSILLGVQGESGLVYTGRAGSGLSELEWVKLSQVLGNLVSPVSPFVNPPRRANIFWTRPLVLAVIEYLEWTSGGEFRHPVIKSVSLERSMI
ncbi:MAG: RNA ligase family protein [Chitinophagales bacterium]